MIDLVLYRKGDAWFPFSEYDRLMGRKYAELRMTRHQTTGAAKMRSYRELCAYWGSCTYIATLGQETTDKQTGKIIRLDTKQKIDDATRYELGFYDVICSFAGEPHLKLRHLCYENCDQDEAHEFIVNALEYHAQLAGTPDVDLYLKFLEGRG